MAGDRSKAKKTSTRKQSAEVVKKTKGSSVFDPSDILVGKTSKKKSARKNKSRRATVSSSAAKNMAKKKSAASDKRKKQSSAKRAVRSVKAVKGRADRLVDSANASSADVGVEEIYKQSVNDAFMLGSGAVKKTASTLSHSYQGSRASQRAAQAIERKRLENTLGKRKYARRTSEQALAHARMRSMRKAARQGATAQAVQAQGTVAKSFAQLFVKPFSTIQSFIASAVAKVASFTGVGLVAGFAGMFAAVMLVMGLFTSTVVSNAGYYGQSSNLDIVRIAEREYQAGERNGDYWKGGQKYWSFMGFNSYAYWCAAFVSYCAEEAGLIAQGIVPKSANCGEYLAFYLGGKKGWEQGATSADADPTKGMYFPQGSCPQVMVGDFVIFNNSTTYGHIGIVVKVDKDGTVHTIEGNASDKCQRRTYTADYMANGASYSISAPDIIRPKYPAQTGNRIDIPEYISGVDRVGAYENVRTGVYATREWDLAKNNFASSSYQRKVQDAWKERGSESDVYGFQTLDGKYLIAVTPTFGAVGDEVVFYMSDGTVLDCIIIDHKVMITDPTAPTPSYDSTPANEWGHAHGANVLEFCGTSAIGDNPYIRLGLSGARTVYAINLGQYVEM